MVGWGLSLDPRAPLDPKDAPANQVRGGEPLSAFHGANVDLGSGTVSLERGGAWELANTGDTANSLTGSLRGSSGGVRRLTAFLPKIHPGQSNLTSHPNSWRSGIRRAQGSARRIREAPGPGSEALHRWSATQGAGPTARLGPVPRGGGRFTKTAAGSPGPAQPSDLLASLCVRRRRPSARPRRPDERAAASFACAGSPG